MEENDQAIEPTHPRRRRGAIVAGALVTLLVLGALVWLVTWSLRNQGEEARQADTGFDRYRTDWESAMNKAGVEATFPGGPVDLEEVQPTGKQPFSATFTPEEVSALLVIYRYLPDAPEGRAEIEDMTVAFPQDGQGVLEGRFVLDGEPYQAQMRAQVDFADGKIAVSQEGARLSVEGFSIGGSRREAAVTAISEYLNAMLQAAPGLTVERAEIIEGGIRVEGTCPVKIEHPDAISPTGKGAALAQSSRI